MISKFKIFLLLLLVTILGFNNAFAQNEIQILSQNNYYVNPNNISQKGTELTFKVNFYTTAVAAKFDTLYFVVFPKSGIPKYIENVFVLRPDFNMEFRKVDFLSSNSTLIMTLDTVDKFGTFRLRMFDTSPNDYCSLNIALEVHSKIAPMNEYILRNIGLSGCITNIEDVVLVNGNVYPNPFSNKVTFELPNIVNNSYLNIYNINGEKVFESNFDNNNQTFDLIDLKSGFYYFKINSGNELFQGKLIKQ